MSIREESLLERQLKNDGVSWNLKEHEIRRLVNSCKTLAEAHQKLLYDPTFMDIAVEQQIYLEERNPEAAIEDK